jgi:low temperature requirement protein LtrA
MTTQLPSRLHQSLISILKTAFVIFALSILLLWSWNSLLVDLFDLPTARFKHALAAELFVAALMINLRFVASSSSILHNLTGRHTGGPE